MYATWTLRNRARGLLVRALARRDEDLDRNGQQVYPHAARHAGHQPDHVQVRSRSLLVITVLVLVLILVLTRTWRLLMSRAENKCW